MNQLIKLKTQHGENVSTELVIDNRSTHKSFTVKSSHVGGHDLKVSIEIDTVSEDRKVFVENVCLRGVEVDLLIEFLTQKS
jgi:hypothetical protein